jgi:dipeptidyl aminopeptidase/acylaminoacyl peptidase
MLMLPAEPGLNDPTWSPDGNSIAYAVGPAGDRPEEVRILDVQTQKSSKVPGSEGM